MSEGTVTLLARAIARSQAFSFESQQLGPIVIRGAGDEPTSLETAFALAEPLAEPDQTLLDAWQAGDP